MKMHMEELMLLGQSFNLTFTIRKKQKKTNLKMKTKYEREQINDYSAVHG